MGLEWLKGYSKPAVAFSIGKLGWRSGRKGTLASRIAWSEQNNFAWILPPFPSPWIYLILRNFLIQELFPSWICFLQALKIPAQFSFAWEIQGVWMGFGLFPLSRCSRILPSSSSSSSWCDQNVPGAPGSWNSKSLILAEILEPAAGMCPGEDFTWSCFRLENPGNFCLEMPEPGMKGLPGSGLCWRIPGLRDNWDGHHG